MVGCMLLGPGRGSLETRGTRTVVISGRVTPLLLSKVSMVTLGETLASVWPLEWKTYILSLVSNVPRGSLLGFPNRMGVGPKYANEVSCLCFLSGPRASLPSRKSSEMPMHVFAVAADNRPVSTLPLPMCLALSPCLVKGASLFVRPLPRPCLPSVPKSIRLRYPVPYCRTSHYVPR